MYRIDNATAITPIPAPAAVGPNPDHFFTKGNPALAVPATIVDDDFLNAVQEEICNVITGAGIALDKTKRNQLFTALTGGNLGRTRLAAATTFHISLAGNDANNGLTIGTAWATFAHAISVLQSSYDTNGKVVTFQWDSAAVCPQEISIVGPQVGVTDPTQYIFDFNAQGLTAAAAANFVARNGAMALIQNAVVSNTSSNGGIVATDRGYIVIGNGMTFGVQVGTGIQIVAQLGGRIGNITGGNYTITGGAGAHMQANLGGQINIIAGVITLTGTPAFASAFAAASNCGALVFSGAFAGGATGSRYTANANGVVNTGGGGATFFPGNAAGTLATGGQYA